MLKPLFKFIMWITYITSKGEKGEDRLRHKEPTLERLREHQRKIAREWNYVYDKWHGIRNHITPPAEAVNQKSGDCDDFASHMYRVGEMFRPLLLTYFPTKITKAHTVTVLRPNPSQSNAKYILLNWGHLKSFSNIEDLYKELERYANSRIVSFHWAEYDYNKRRFVNIKSKNI